MTPYTVRILGLILAQQALLEGMKASNQARTIQNLAPAHRQHAFDCIAQELERLANEVAQQ